MTRLARYAWLVLVFNVAVVLWGAVVRATVSGAGCGQHWPLCNGQYVPTLQSVKTQIEFSHRITSGLALVLVVVLAVWAYRARATQPLVWRPARVAVALMFMEALLGAGLVLLKLVAHDESVRRAVSMALHLTNTFFLLGAITWTASAATFGTWPTLGAPRRWGVLGGVVLLLVTGISGAIAALGDTLFPAASLAAGLASDHAESAHFLVRLRSLHPVFAVIAAAVLALGTNRLLEDASPRLARLGRAFQVSLGVQLAIGLVNLVLLVPLWTQLVHLLSADAVIILYALVAAEALDQWGGLPAASSASVSGASPARSESATGRNGGRAVNGSGTA